MEARTQSLHPGVYRPSATIDRRGATRQVQMEVLSLGMPRTATASMKAALQLLGYNDVYHMFNVFNNVKDADLWHDAFVGKYLDTSKAYTLQEWDALLGHCQAVTDAPCAVFALELMDAYPNAKIVLVEREYTSWRRSFQIIINSSFDPRIAFSKYLNPGYTGRLARMTKVWLGGEFDAKTKRDMEVNAERAYREHYRRIRDKAKEQGREILEYQLGSGWDPLCSFLGRDVPRNEDGTEMAFPRINEQKALQEYFQSMFTSIVRKSVYNIAWFGGWAGVIGVAVLWTRVGRRGMLDLRRRWFSHWDFSRQ